jgi:hypothetical protein
MLKVSSPNKALQPTAPRRLSLGVRRSAREQFVVRVALRQGGKNLASNAAFRASAASARQARLAIARQLTIQRYWS